MGRPACRTAHRCVSKPVQPSGSLRHSTDTPTTWRKLHETWNVPRTRPGFAGFPSAGELHAGFTNKARLAMDHLKEQIDLTRHYAAEIRAAGAAYIETDSTNSTLIGEAGTTVSPDTGSR